MSHYVVYRIGKCITCGNKTCETLGNYEALNAEEAKSKAVDNWMHEYFGQSGALQENEITDENIFLSGEFIAEESHE